MDGEQGRAGRHLRGARPAAAKLTVRPEPLPTSTSCCGAIRAEFTPGALCLPRCARLRLEEVVWLDNDGGDLHARGIGASCSRACGWSSSIGTAARGRSHGGGCSSPRPSPCRSPRTAPSASRSCGRLANRAGYWSKKQLEANDRIKSRLCHGFDMGKLTPSSLFYLPCQAENPAHSFFIDHNARPGADRSTRLGGIRREPSPTAAGTRSDGQPDGRATGAATDAGDRLPQTSTDARTAGRGRCCAAS